MQDVHKRNRINGAAWTAVLLAALILLILTLALCLRSDDANRSDVMALITGDQPMVVLRHEPAIGADIAGLLSRFQRVTVLTFDPQENPDWALVQSGDTVGWVPLDRLSERP